MRRFYQESSSLVWTFLFGWLKSNQTDIQMDQVLHKQAIDKAFQKKYECVDVIIDGEMTWWISKEKSAKMAHMVYRQINWEKYQRKFTEPLSAEQLGEIVLKMLALK